MPDISMCQGQNCEARSNCYRHTAVPNVSWQSWFIAPPIFIAENIIENRCVHFLDNKPPEEVKTETSEVSLTETE